MSPIANRVAVKRHAQNHRAYSVVSNLTGLVFSGSAELTLDEALKSQAESYKWLARTYSDHIA